jgi:thiamine transport system permease protein
LLAAPPLLFLLAFFFYPVVAILGLGLAPGGQLDLLPALDTLAQPYVHEVLWFTLWQAALSTLLTVVLALPAAYVFARFEFPGKRALSALSIVPFVLPTVVVASAFLALVGPRGALPVRLDRTILLILVAHVFYNFAIVLRIVGGLWAQLDPRMEDAARVLGASRWRAFREITLPLLTPAIASAASIVFLFTFTSFGVILLLGGPTFATLEVEIYRQTADLLNLPAAATLALLQMVGLTILLFVYARLQDRLAVRTRLLPARLTSRPARTRGERTFVGATLAGTLLLLGLPLLALIERSLKVGDGYGLDNFTGLFGPARGGLFVPPSQAIADSLVFAITATTICIVLGLPAAAVIAYRGGLLGQAFDTTLMLPLGTSAVIVGFGFIVALGRIPGLPFDLRTSPLLIPIAHALIALPFVVRAVAPVMRSVDRRLREAAATLGAPPSRVWREVDWPLIRRATLVGAGFAFAVSLGEFGATLFIARPDTPTIPIAIYRFLGQPGAANFGSAMAMSVLLMVVTGLSILFIDRFRAGVAGQF